MHFGREWPTIEKFNTIDEHTMRRWITRYSSMIAKLSSQGKAMRIWNGGYEDVENSLVKYTDLRSEFYQAGIT